MTVKLSSLKIDLTRETEGDWQTFPDWQGVEFKVSPFTKPSYQTARDLAMQRLQRQFGAKRIPDEEARTTAARLYVDHILHDWKGFDEPYSKELALGLLAELSGRRIVEAVEWCAAQVAKVNVEFVEDETKNFEPSSGKVSKGAGATATG